MIVKKKTEVFTTEDGTEHKTLELAQRSTIEKMLVPYSTEPDDNATLAAFLVSKAEELVEILTTKARKPRKANGKPGGRKRLPLAIKSDKPVEAAT